VTADEILARLRRSGHRDTSPRRVILEAIVARSGAFTVQELVDELAAAGVGRATVFRTINTLEDIGYVARLHVGPECDRYTLCSPGEHHHHLVCTSCGDVFPIAECTVDSAAAEAARRISFSIRGHHVDVYGSCVSCAEAAGAAKG